MKMLAPHPGFVVSWCLIHWDWLPKEFDHVRNFKGIVGISSLKNSRKPQPCCWPVTPSFGLWVLTTGSNWRKSSHSSSSLTFSFRLLMYTVAFWPCWEICLVAMVKELPQFPGSDPALWPQLLLLNSIWQLWKMTSNLTQFHYFIDKVIKMHF